MDTPQQCPTGRASPPQVGTERPNMSSLMQDDLDFWWFLGTVGPLQFPRVLAIFWRHDCDQEAFPSPFSSAMRTLDRTSSSNFLSATPVGRNPSPTMILSPLFGPSFLRPRRSTLPNHSAMHCIRISRSQVSGFWSCGFRCPIVQHCDLVFSMRNSWERLNSWQINTKKKVPPVPSRQDQASVRAQIQLKLKQIARHEWQTMLKHVETL